MYTPVRNRTPVPLFIAKNSTNVLNLKDTRILYYSEFIYIEQVFV